MKLFCPECGSEIDPGSVDVAEGTARCPVCGLVSKAADLARGAKGGSDLEPPTGTRILFRLGKDGGEFELPRRGLTPMHLMMIVFAGMLLGGFLAFFQAIVSEGWIFLLLFTPFWAVGMAILVVIVNSIREKQFIELERDRLVIRLDRPLFSREKVLPFSEIDAISLDRLKIEDAVKALKFAGPIQEAGEGGPDPLAPTITHGGQRTTFAEAVSEKEKRWIIAVIKEFILQKTGRAV